MQAINQAVKDFMSIFKNDLKQAAIRSKEVIIGKTKQYFSGI